MKALWEGPWALRGAGWRGAELWGAAQCPEKLTAGKLSLPVRPLTGTKQITRLGHPDGQGAVRELRYFSRRQRSGLQALPASESRGEPRPGHRLQVPRAAPHAPCSPLSLQHTQHPKVTSNASYVSSPRCRLQSGSRDDD